MDIAARDSSLVASFSNGLADAVESAGKALVLVNGRQRHPASGIVYAQDLVLTADHVLEREEDITIQTPDGRTMATQFGGRDPASDLALLKVADLGLDPARTADGPPRVGQIVLAIGRPSPDGVMASIGIISAVGGPLRGRGGAMLEQYIQTDATPYPGFSGGPIVDTQGRLLAITTTGLIPGVTLAIPTAIAWGVAEALASNGHVKRGFLGISSQPVHIPLSQRGGRTQERGLLIVRVEEDSPAQRGGLLLGDILLRLDGHEVSDTDDLQSLWTGERVGGTVAVDVIRGGAVQALQVTVGQRT